MFLRSLSLLFFIFISSFLIAKELPVKKPVLPTTAKKTSKPAKGTTPPKNTSSQKITVDELLKKMDELFRQESSIAEVSMTIKNPK